MNIILFLVLNTNMLLKIKYFYKKFVSGENDKIQDMEESKDNINIRAAAIHIIGDFIQSVGVLIAAIIIYCKVK